MPDEYSPPDAGSQAPEQAAPSQAPQSFSQSQSAPQPAPGYDGGQGGQPQMGGQSQANVYEAFRNLPEFQGADDTTIARTLYQSMQGYRESQRQLQQYQQMMPATLDYLRNADQYRRWQAEQQRAAQPQPQAQPKWWDPPQVKDEWRSYIVRDPETGREVIAPDAPLEARAAIQNYQAYTANFAKKFVTDPEGTLKPFIESVVTQRAQELVQQQLGQYTAQNYVSSLEEQNRDWLYDQNGQVTPEGQAIQQYIAQAARSGIANPQERWQYATSMLERDLLNLRHQQIMQMQQQAMAQQQAQMGMPPGMQGQPQYPPQGPDPRAQANMEFLRQRAIRAPSRSGGATEPRAPKPKMTFDERLRRQFIMDGVT